MPRKKVSEENAVKQSKDEIRAEIRSYIRNERDTVLKKWLALNESIKSEDYCRSQAMERKHMQDTKSLPMNVMKFIGTLRKSVRNTMRYKGGTPFSIIRKLFLYWDADKSGRISADELFYCMKSLGAKVPLENCAEIVRFYNDGDPGGEMDYTRLLMDIQNGEPSIIAFVSQEEEKQKDQTELRFEEVNDKFVQMPMIVVKFLEAVRVYLLRTMQSEGGTPYQHIRAIFQFYDFDYSNGLDYEELVMAVRRKMKLSITHQQAKEIIAYYDRKQVGEISYEKFLNDVCVDVKPILHFTDLSARGIAAHKASLAQNPFIPKGFSAPENKMLENFKQKLKMTLVLKIQKLGGTVASWIRDAFIVWDRGFTGRISDWTALQGAAKRLGVVLNEEECRAIMKCYDRFDNGEMHYLYLSAEITKEDPHFLMNAKLPEKKIDTTSRTPTLVNDCLQKIKTAVSRFVTLSKGKVEARDIFHGTCVRFDAERNGKLTLQDLRSVLTELRGLKITDQELTNTRNWFDTDGSKLVDYNSMTRQMYGTDISTERLILPKLKESSNAGSLLSTISAQTMKTRSGSTGTFPLTAPFGVKNETLERNLDLAESQAVKNARMKQKRSKILAEKAKTEKKLASIEEQKKKIIEDYKVKRGKT